MAAVIDKPIISADSHITEPGDMYQGRVARAFEDRVPRLIKTPEGVEAFAIEGVAEPFPITMASAAGFRGEALAKRVSTPYADCFRGGWDPRQRLYDQDTDGIAAEVLYPSMGMLLCSHPDAEYKTACFDAYNAWLAEYCAAAPDRLIGLGQTAMASPEQGVKDLEKIRALGLRGVMMPGHPTLEDYDSRIYDPFWEAVSDMGVPLAFHILTYKGGLGGWRGPRANRFMGLLRANQDILGVLIFGGVFDRFPKLRVVCAEADAGWAPHYAYRMDHAAATQVPRPGEVKLSRRPSEFFFENVYLTFQDDEIAFRFKDSLNVERMMWASDFPHLDSTWPKSQALLAKQTGGLTGPEKEKVLHDNVAALYGLAL